MATRIVKLFQNDSAGKHEIFQAFGGRSLSLVEQNSVIMESNLDSFENSIETVPKLFSHGSHFIKARVDTRNIEMVIVFISPTDGWNPISTFNFLFSNPKPDLRLALTYENNDISSATVKEYNECYLNSYEIKKVGMAPEVAYELTLSLISLDGK